MDPRQWARLTPPGVGQTVETSAVIAAVLTGVLGTQRDSAPAGCPVGSSTAGPPAGHPRCLHQGPACHPLALGTILKASRGGSGGHSESPQVASLLPSLQVSEEETEVERGKEHSQQHNCVLHPGEGDGNSLRYSCLENPMDRGAHGLRGCRESDMTRRLNSSMVQHPRETKRLCVDCSTGGTASCWVRWMLKSGGYVMDATDQQRKLRTSDWRTRAHPDSPRARLQGELHGSVS